MEKEAPHTVPDARGSSSQSETWPPSKFIKGVLQSSNPYWTFMYSFVYLYTHVYVDSYTYVCMNFPDHVSLKNCFVQKGELMMNEFSLWLLSLLPPFRQVLHLLSVCSGGQSDPDSNCTVGQRGTRGRISPSLTRRGREKGCYGQSALIQSWLGPPSVKSRKTII